MEILSKYRFIFLFLAGAIVAVTAGNFAWQEKKAPMIAAAYARHSFLLIDDEDNLFGTRNLKEGEKLLLIFMPDILSGSSETELKLFSQSLLPLEYKKIQVAFVSRANLDSLRNLKRRARFTGRILRDPSGSLGRIFEAWPSFEPVKEWQYRLTDKNLSLLWSTSSSHLSSDELKF
jgi:peroxiredoxin